MVISSFPIFKTAHMSNELKKIPFYQSLFLQQKKCICPPRFFPIFLMYAYNLFVHQRHKFQLSKIGLLRHTILSSGLFLFIHYCYVIKEFLRV